MKKVRGFIKPYGSYLFKAKDPAIDIWRTTLQRSGFTLKQIEEKGGAKRATNNRQLNGPTLRTRFDTLMANMRAAGGDIQFIMPKSGEVVKIPKGGRK